MIDTRPATLVDAAVIAAVLQESPEAPQWTAAQIASAIASQAAHTQRRVWIAIVDGAPCGFVAASALPGGEGELENIAVGPIYRGKGVGGLLLRCTVDWMMELRVSIARLEVRAGSQPAQALYARMGFTATGTRARYYREPIEDAVLMEVCLPSTGTADGG